MGKHVDQDANEYSGSDSVQQEHDDTTARSASSAASHSADSEITILNQLLPQYKILELLGYGGQGVVYRAIQRSAGRLVALKVLHHDASASERRCQRFEREVAVIARLRHPHVITVFESGTVSGRPYLSMELVNGLPIDDFILLHRPPITDIVGLFEKVCRAVASVHQRGVIHRDLKPSNILVDLDSEPHILDFGLAKCFDDGGNSQPLSMVGQVVGTLPFLSPEQALANDAVVDLRSDVYTLGVILYLLLTGAMPYSVDGPPERVKQTILEQLPIKPDRRVGADENATAHEPIPIDLSHVVMKALAKEKERRYQSADAFADDLHRCLTHDIVLARADSRWYVLRRAARRYRVHVLLGATFLVLIIVGLVSSLVLWHRAEQAARLAQVGMQMGSDVRLGSIRRDEGRFDQAIELCRRAIEFGEQVQNPDVVVNRLLYAAHHDLAQAYLLRPDDQPLCLHHGAEALRIAAGLAQEHSQEPEYQRMLAFARRLTGRIAYRCSDWQRSETEFEQSIQLFDALAAGPVEARDSVPIEFEAAYSRQFLARVWLKTDRRTKGLRMLQTVRETMTRVCAKYPDSLDYLLELIRTCDLLAEHLLRGNTLDENQRASDLLAEAESRLQQVFDSNLADRRLRHVRELVESVRQHTGLANKRLATVDAPPSNTQSGSSSPSGVSTGSSSPSIGSSPGEARKE